MDVHVQCHVCQLFSLSYMYMYICLVHTLPHQMLFLSLCWYGAVGLLTLSTLSGMVISLTMVSLSCLLCQLVVCTSCRYYIIYFDHSLLLVPSWLRLLSPHPARPRASWCSVPAETARLASQNVTTPFTHAHIVIHFFFFFYVYIHVYYYTGMQ